MADIQISVEGQDAVAATEELLAISGLWGNWETTGDGEKEGTLIIIRLQARDNSRSRRTR
ncbi:hypothetical protein D0A34_24790 [Microcoleus vaginatus PCC 9802]|uniref:hypothetical protein n=1 Tax=Microcoleus vaginatus TaxID=119532 RepID=UPI0002F91675|nr:hypothetical protein D0A34_24790 [Microcoleus vaginatus PCC 9802]